MVGRCQAQFPSQVSRPVSPTPETHSAARAGHGSPPGCPATSPHITGSPGWCSDPGPRTASVPETTLHRVTTHTARHCGLCPECERRCLFQSSRLTPECPCPSPELNGMEATCPFRACGPRAWTRMTQARPPALEAACPRVSPRGPASPITARVRPCAAGCWAHLPLRGWLPPGHPWTAWLGNSNGFL